MDALDNRHSDGDGGSLRRAGWLDSGGWGTESERNIHSGCKSVPHPDGCARDGNVDSVPDSQPQQYADTAPRHPHPHTLGHAGKVGPAKPTCGPGTG